MGLDTTHDCFHGSYSAFSRWRDEIARAAGMPFESPPPDAWRRDPWPAVYNQEWPAPIFDGEWEEDPEDILLVLILHSDCDGYIYPHHCGPLADRLEEILPKLPDYGEGHIARAGGYRKATEKFIKGLRLAAKRGEKVGFR